MVPGENGAIGVPAPGDRTIVFGMDGAYGLEDGAAWPMAPQKSAAVETQPKNFSMLYSDAWRTKSGPAWCVASARTTAKYSRWNASRNDDSTQTLVATPVNTRVRMPRAR